MVNPIRLTIVLVTSLLYLSACGGGGGGSSPNDEPNQIQSEYSYSPMSVSVANEYFSGKNTTDLLLVHSDGFGNSDKNIADVNLVMMDRDTDGNLYIAYDGTYQEDTSTVNEPLSRVISNVSLYIDSDGNPNTGKSVGDIGADVQLGNTSQYYWDSENSSWQQTWFETEEPILGIHISGLKGYRIFQDINNLGSVKASFNVYRKIRYLDALVLASNAKAVLQLKHDIFDENISMYKEVPLDTSSSFSIPSF